MSVTSAQGFRASGVAAGLKSSGGLDVAVVVNDGPNADAAAVFTSNRCKANPVLWSEQAIKPGAARAVVLNSGGANCYTGAEGFAVTHSVAELAAELLSTDQPVAPIEIQVCSTGLIGLRPVAEAMRTGVRAAVAGLSSEGGTAAAEAIMTTDSVPKVAERTVDGWTIGAMAKGAGMLAPALATMLVVITTDADLPSEALQDSLRLATAQTFDRLDSDGCQSTNDTVLLMASGASASRPAVSEFARALTEVCHDLAMQLLADAEGADHEIAIEVVGAQSQRDALEVGRSVARSNLFKTAIYGKDPNWGRILASVGTTEAVFDPADLDVALNGVWVCRNSAIGESPALVDLSPRSVSVTIDLKSGDQSATVWTNDLTEAYVHENSAYST